MLENTCTTVHLYCFAAFRVMWSQSTIYCAYTSKLYQWSSSWPLGTHLNCTKRKLLYWVGRKRHRWVLSASKLRGGDYTSNAKKANKPQHPGHMVVVQYNQEVSSHLRYPRKNILRINTQSTGEDRSSIIRGAPRGGCLLSCPYSLISLSFLILLIFSRPRPELTASISGSYQQSKKHIPFWSTNLKIDNNSTKCIQNSSVRAGAVKCTSFVY